MNDAKRNAQLSKWIRAAEEHETLEYEDEVMWGVVLNLEDESRPPIALFQTEEEANAYATLFQREEWDVSPYVLDIKGRNNFEVPKPVK